MTKVSLMFELHPLDVTTGHWCAVCSLPSVVRIVVAVVDHETLRIGPRVIATKCVECGENLTYHDRG